MSSLCSIQEEADTRIILHAVAAAEDKTTPIAFKIMMQKAHQFQPFAFWDVIMRNAYQ